MSWCVSLVPWCASLVSWCASLVPWCASLVPWCTSLVPWCARLVSWCARLVSWCARLVSWCAGVVFWCASLVSWCARLVSWCASLVSWCASLVSWCESVAFLQWTAFTLWGPLSGNWYAGSLTFCMQKWSTRRRMVNERIFSSADKVSSAELMVLLICPSSVVRRRPSVVVRPSTFALNRYSSYSSYSIILNFLLEKLAI